MLPYTHRAPNLPPKVIYLLSQPRNVKNDGKNAEVWYNKDSSGQFRFRLKAPNGEIIAVGEACTTKDASKNGIASVKENAARAEILHDRKHGIFCFQHVSRAFSILFDALHWSQFAMMVSYRQSEAEL